MHVTGIAEQCFFDLLLKWCVNIGAGATGNFSHRRKLLTFHRHRHIMPPLVYGALSNDARLTSVAYIWPKSRTERPGKTKIGTEVAHVTRDSDTTFKVKRSTCRGRGHIVASSRAACY